MRNHFKRHYEKIVPVIITNRLETPKKVRVLVQDKVRIYPNPTIIRKVKDVLMIDGKQKEVLVESYQF